MMELLFCVHRKDNENLNRIHTKVKMAEDECDRNIKDVNLS